LSFISVAHNKIHARNMEMAKLRHVGFQILTVVAMKFQVFLHMLSCWLRNNFKQCHTPWNLYLQRHAVFSHPKWKW